MDASIQGIAKVDASMAVWEGWREPGGCYIDAQENIDNLGACTEQKPEDDNDLYAAGHRALDAREDNDNLDATTHERMRMAWETEKCASYRRRVGRRRSE
jgi:hypothetical protein